MKIVVRIQLCIRRERKLKMRKLNALIVIAIITILGVHSIAAALYLGGCIDYSLNYKMTGRRLFIILCCHILISLVLLISDSVKHRKIRKYGTLIRDTRIQAISGIGIIFFMTGHVILYSIHSAVNSPDDIIMVMLHVLFDFLLIARLFISLGIINSQQGFYKAARITKRIMAALWLGYMAAEVLFYL